jgi:hypothetical protein
LIQAALRVILGAVFSLMAASGRGRYNVQLVLTIAPIFALTPLMAHLQ